MGSDREKKMNSGSEHIVMFPYLAQGHIIPFLSLADLLLRRRPTLAITLLTTPFNLLSLRSNPNLALPPNLRLHSLPLSPSDHGLPPDADNTDSLPLPALSRLFHASLSLRPHFALFLSSLPQPPLAVVADVFFAWTIDITRPLSIFHATFTTCGAYGTAAYFSLWRHLPHTLTPSDEFPVPGFPEPFRLRKSQLSAYLRSADGADVWSTFFRPQIEQSLSSDAFICNTVDGLEEFGLRVLRSAVGRPVYAVGPLLPLDSNSSSGRTGRAPGVEVGLCADFLDSQRPASVVYVSFGSQNSISTSQMMALGAGLEASGKPFIWAIRPPLGFDVKGEMRPEWLPAGFEERMRAEGRGILVRRWAPQLEILSHSSTGAFITHCGWNSALESLSRGVPMIGWPLASEQFYNSKMMEEELGVGLEVARGVGSEVKGEEVERAVRAVVEGGKGREMRAKARELAKVIREAMKVVDGREVGSSIRAVDEFLAAAARSKAGKMMSSPAPPVV